MQYEAQASTIRIEDIASNDNNRLILHRLKRNSGDDEYNQILYIQKLNDSRITIQEVECEEDDYTPEGAYDMGWLGYFIGKNNHLKELDLSSFTRADTELIEPLLRGVNNNKSIDKLNFYGTDLLGGRVFTMLVPFFTNNDNFVTISTEECVLGEEEARLLALAIGSFNSLTDLTIINADIADEGLVEIITALSMHPNMKGLCLNGNQLQKNGCKALSNLLKYSCTEFEHLNLDNNEMDDEGIDALVPALKKSSNLRKLMMNDNPSITTKGWRHLASILEAPNSKLNELYIMGNNIGMASNNIKDEVVASFASSLVNNRSFLSMGIYDNNETITEKGWRSLLNLLCDTSSVNSTFLSNHKLAYVTGSTDASLKPLLILNCRRDKKEVAMIKILKHHNDFDMTPFFEWEFKVLPLMIGWFERASTIEMPRDYEAKASLEANIGRKKLSSIYQFVRGMPDMYVETRLRQELEEIKAARLQMEERERGILERLGRK